MRLKVKYQTFLKKGDRRFLRLSTKKLMKLKNNLGKKKKRKKTINMIISRRKKN